jgi:hypothetical protein
MRAFPLLVVAAILFFVFGYGKVDVDFWAHTEHEPSATTSRPLLNVPPSAGLGKGRRTIADAHWIGRMSGLCRQRNILENSMASPDGSLHSLGRYTARTLWVWDRYQRRAASVRVPTTYAREASWLQQVDAQKRQGFEAVLEATRRRDENAARAALAVFATFSHYAYRGYAKIGLTECGQFMA